MRADVQKGRELAHLLDEDIEAGLLGAPGRGLAPLLLLAGGGSLAIASGSRRRKSGWLPARYQRQPSQLPHGRLASSACSQRRSCVIVSASSSFPTPRGP